MNKVDRNVDNIFDKLDKVYNSVNSDNIKTLIDEVAGEIDEVVFDLKYEIDEKDNEIKTLKEKIFDLKGCRF